MNDNQASNTQPDDLYRTGGIYISQSEVETSFLSVIFFQEKPSSTPYLCWLDRSNWLGYESTDVVQPASFEESNFQFAPGKRSYYGMISENKIALCTDHAITRIYQYFPSTKPFANAWYKKLGNNSDQKLDFRVIIHEKDLYMFDSKNKKQYLEKLKLNLQQNQNGVYTMQYDFKETKKKSKKDHLAEQTTNTITLYFFGFIILWMERTVGSSSNKPTFHWLVIDRSAAPLTESPTPLN